MIYRYKVKKKKGGCQVERERQYIPEIKRSFSEKIITKAAKELNPRKYI